jgi:hypothetical protein
LGLIEDKGWISALDHEDQRVRKISLTPKGMKKASAALVVWKRADASVEPILRRFGLQSRPLMRTKYFFARKCVYTRMIGKRMVTKKG